MPPPALRAGSCSKECAIRFGACKEVLQTAPNCSIAPSATAVDLGPYIGRCLNHPAPQLAMRKAVSYTHLTLPTICSV
eukprot:4036579-Alexandrium_andersonii.AAC.1